MTKSNVTISQAQQAYEILENIVSEDFAGHLETIGIYMDALIRCNEVLVAGATADFSKRLEEAKKAFMQIGYERAVDDVLPDEADRVLAKMSSPYLKENPFDSDPSF